MQQSEQINELAAALAKAQGEITGALKDSANPFFKNKYADLASCWDACRGPLSKNGLAITQFPISVSGPADGMISLGLKTTLMHSSGQYMSDVLHVTPKDESPQAMGSAITYARRYALCAVTGVAQVDDDGNAASGRAVNGNGNHAPYTGNQDPRGDMGKNVPVDKAMKGADMMRSILELDVDDQTLTLKILDHHDMLNKDPDFYVAASDQLSTKEKVAWKKYVTLGKAAQKADAATQPGRRF